MDDASREQRLRELFDRACGLPEPRQRELLADVDDEVLRERLRALLQQDARGTATLLRRGAADAMQTLRRIGPYEVLRELGAGGMGTVLLARQVDPVERLVALKLIRRGIDSASAAERFAQERQTLALMSHPGVASMYEAGTTEDGTLWFSMEYVRGEPITAWCDRRQLPLASRIALFADVCDAVQHAHQKAVLHRDLKPGNVLVAEVGDRPQPKIIDFGVARALLRAPGQRLLPDEEGDIVGTWHYMSPEQADPATQDVDTRSDIYSLGVMLYELLTGELPLQAAGENGAEPGDAEAFWRFRTVLLAQVPPRGSECVAAAEPERRRQTAELRGTTPERLQRALRGELDAILATALAKDRSDRYASASELRADLLRHLRGEAVGVMPPTLRYRLTTFVRRNRAVVAAFALAVLAVLGALAATTWGLVMERHAREVENAAHERELAERQGELARADFFDLLLLFGDPGTGAPPPPLRLVLDRLEPEIERLHPGRSLEQGALRAALGRAYLGLGEPQRAERQLLLAWQAADPGSDPVRTSLLLADLVRAVRKVRGEAAARPFEVRMLEVGVRALETHSPEVSRAVAELAAIVEQPQQRQHVLARCERAIAQVVELPPGSAALRIAGPLLLLFAADLHAAGDDGVGRELLQKLEAAARQELDNDAELLPVLARFAEHLLGTGMLPDARRVAGEVAAALDRHGFRDHWLRLQAERVRGLAFALEGQHAAGETLLLELRDRLAPVPDAANEQVHRAADGLVELGERLQQTGALPEYCRTSLRLWRERTANEAVPRPWWPAELEGLGDAVLRAALAAVEEQAGGDDVALRAVHGALLLRLERFAAALEHLEAAQARAAEPPPELLADLACSYRGVGRTDDARRVEERLAARAAAGDARCVRALARVRAVLGR